VADWPAKPLSADDLKIVDRTNWRVFPKATVIAIAEAWNAGMLTADMARDLGCKPGSLRVLIGKLGQIGLQMRRREDAAYQRAIAPRARSPLAEQMGAEQLARLRRVAQFDPAAKRALELYERGETLNG